MTQKEFEKMFLDLNSVLVKFWIEQGRPAKEIKIELLERMLSWYKKMGYVTLDKQEDKLPEGLEEAAWKYAPDLPSYNIGGGYLPPQSRYDLRTAFKDGAEWQKSKILEWAKERYQQTISNVGCYTGHSVWMEVIEHINEI